MRTTPWVVMVMLGCWGVLRAVEDLIRIWVEHAVARRRVSDNLRRACR